MPDRSAAVAEPLRTLFTLGASGTLSDGDLLGRYLDGRAEEAERAFAVLVERHGPMVRHVCLSVLGDPHDASDAFQATFLVLSRRAGSIRRAESVGPWLFGVARRVSNRARVAAARRRRVERTRAEQDAGRLTVLDPDGHRPDDWAALYQELDRLPSRYRDPLVLCYLEGLSHEQAAARLGCPTGTLRTRLGRARDRLRSRLSRHGLGPASAPAALLTSAVALPARAAIPAGWASTAARLATSARILPAASAAASLAASTLRSMIMITLTRSITLGTAAALGLGAGLAGVSAWGNSRSEQAVDDPPTAAPVTLSSVESGQEGDEPSSAPAEAQPRPAPGFGPPGVGSSDRRLPVSVRARSEVEGEIRIVSLVPEPGAVVAKDQLIAELDVSSLTDQLANQQIATERANADYQNAIKTREVSEIDLTHFKEGVYPQELDAAKGEIELAQAELDLARARLERAEQLSEKLLVGELEVEELRVEVLRAELALKKAEKAFEVLKIYTGDRQIRTLEGAIERAKADELAKMSRHVFEKEKEEKLRRMIEKCRIYAPAPGIVRYPEGIEEGATVRERQLLFWIDPSPENPAISEVNQQMRVLFSELRARLAREEPLTEEERGSFKERYEAVLERFEAAQGRPVPKLEFDEILKRLIERGNLGR